MERIPGRADGGPGGADHPGPDADHPPGADRVPPRPDGHPDRAAGRSGEGPMIGKISVPRGKRCEPLIYYLFGPGRHEEHTDPHIVAGWRHPAELEPSLRPDSRRDFRALFGLLNQPHQAMGSFGDPRPVWHCALRAAPGDKMLSDDEWAQIAHDVMDRTGLAPLRARGRGGAVDRGPALPY
jgi:hypothetical protein